jgi:leucyl/phenylalanyl-tRNA--protein transferase
VWPDPSEADPDEGLVAVGGDLSPSRLLSAYSRGIFPWYGEETAILWWSPEPRAVIELANLHVSRSLKRRLRQAEFTVQIDTHFASVVDGCALRAEGTWITSEMRQAYLRLHELGHAHCFEVWKGEQLAGGLYGVQVGGLFAAESMFHQETDASKVALVTAVTALFAAGFQLFDVQFLTPHLARLGATVVPRHTYLEALKEANGCEIPWKTMTDALRTVHPNR